MQIVSRETSLMLRKYYEMIVKWNQKINLVSRRDMDSLWARHILDCVQLMKLIGRCDIKVIDFGSGCGLPGIVLSILGVKEVQLIEADFKKSIFLQEALKISPNKCVVYNKRVEDIEGLSCDILVSRATCDIQKLLKCCQNIEIKNYILTQKGSTYVDEIANALKDELFCYSVHDSMTSLEGKIIKIWPENLQ